MESTQYTLISGMLSNNLSNFLESYAQRKWGKPSVLRIPEGSSTGSINFGSGHRDQVDQFFDELSAVQKCYGHIFFWDVAQNTDLSEDQAALMQNYSNRPIGWLDTTSSGFRLYSSFDSSTGQKTFALRRIGQAPADIEDRIKSSGLFTATKYGYACPMNSQTAAFFSGLPGTKRTKWTPIQIYAVLSPFEDFYGPDHDFKEAIPPEPAQRAGENFQAAPEQVSPAKNVDSPSEEVSESQSIVEDHPARTEPESSNDPDPEMEYRNEQEANGIPVSEQAPQDHEPVPEENKELTADPINENQEDPRSEEELSFASIMMMSDDEFLAIPAGIIKGLPLEKYDSLFSDFEAENYHPHNIVLEAKRYGSDLQIQEAEDIYSAQEKAGELTPELASRSKKLIEAFFMIKHGDTYSDWEDAVTTAIEGTLEITRGDAQGIVEAHEFEMRQAWGEGLDAEKTAERLTSADKENLPGWAENQLNQILAGKAVVVGEDWLDLVEGSDAMNNIVTIPNPNQIGTKDLYLAGLLSNPQIKAWRIEQGFEEPEVADAPPDGWSEASPGGMMTNRDPVAGGIIDKAITTDEWFVVPEDDRIAKMGGLASRADAYRALMAEVEKLEKSETAASISGPDKIKEAKKHLKSVASFLSSNQIRAMRSFLNGEEGEYYADKIKEYADRIAAMPKTYEQGGKGDDAMVYLHYFKKDSDWYITEKDMEEDEQIQAYGYAILNGDLEMAERGYINIQELTQFDVEMDLYFEPCPLKQIKNPDQDEDQDEESASVQSTVESQLQAYLEQYLEPRRSRIRQSLEQKQFYNGEQEIKKDALPKLIQQGYEVGFVEVDGRRKRVLMKSENEYLSHLTKSELDYAKYLSGLAPEAAQDSDVVKDPSEGESVDFQENDGEPDMVPDEQTDESDADEWPDGAKVTGQEVTYLEYRIEDYVEITGQEVLMKNFPGVQFGLTQGRNSWRLSEVSSGHLIKQKPLEIPLQDFLKMAVDTVERNSVDVNALKELIAKACQHKQVYLEQLQSAEAEVEQAHPEQSAWIKTSYIKEILASLDMTEGISSNPFFYAKKPVGAGRSVRISRRDSELTLTVMDQSSKIEIMDAEVKLEFDSVKGPGQVLFVKAYDSKTFSYRQTERPDAPEETQAAGEASLKTVYDILNAEQSEAASESKQQDPEVINLVDSINKEGAPSTQDIDLAGVESALDYLDLSSAARDGERDVVTPGVAYLRVKKAGPYWSIFSNGDEILSYSSPEEALKFAEILETSRRYTGAMAKAESLFEDHKMKYQNVARYSGKSYREKYLMGRFGISDTAARELTNLETREGIPSDTSTGVSIEEFKGEPWADNALALPEEGPDEVLNEWARNSLPDYNPRESADNIAMAVKERYGNIEWSVGENEYGYKVVFGQISVEGLEGSGKAEISPDGKAIFWINGERLSGFFASSDLETQQTAVFHIINDLTFPDQRANDGLVTDAQLFAERVSDPVGAEYKIMYRVQGFDCPDTFDPEDYKHLFTVKLDGDEWQEKLFVKMQGDRWSPQGEAVEFIRGLGLHHTSMSVGDIVQDLSTGEYHMVDHVGFKTVTPSMSSTDQQDDGHLAVGM